MSLSVVSTAIVVPPLNLLPLGLAGLVIAQKWRGLGRAISSLALVGLIVLSLPIVGGSMLVALERGLPLTPPPGAPPAAIVVLGADEIRAADGTLPAVDVGALTLERVRAAAILARRTGLPVLVSGGAPEDVPTPVATLMAESLATDFAVKPRWVETRSLDTWQNAEESAAILRQAGISSVYVVTHAWHERRALIAFAHAGITATAAPVRLDRAAGSAVADYVPRISGWEMSYYALHEAIGCLYYLLLSR